MDIEKLATSAVKTAISKTNCLKAFISDEDKEPCWDGNIYCYEQKDYSKHNLKRVATQIKGKKTKAKTIKNTIKYSIDNDDLYAYMMNGGAIYFVVYIDEATGECLQIYYVALLPIKIQEILKKSTRNTHSVMLKKYPQNSNEQERIVLDFYSESKRQASFVGKKFPSIKELSKTGVLESISLKAIGSNIDKYNPSTLPIVLPKLLENSDLTLYANLKGGVASIPVEYYESIHSVETMQIINEGVGVETTEFYNSYKLTVNNRSKEYHLGTCVKAIMPNDFFEENKRNIVKVQVQLRIKGNLSERIKGIDFFLSMEEQGSFFIGKTIYKAGKRLSKKELDKLKSILINYKKAKSFLQTLNIEKDLDLDNWKEEDYKNFELIVSGLGKKKPVVYVATDEMGIQLIQISNLSIAVLYYKSDNNYYMFDYYGNDYFLYNKENGVHIPRFRGLSSDIILHSSNLNLDTIVKDFKSLNQTEENWNYGNLVLLEMIKAYDIKPNSPLLSSIKKMVEWLDSQPSLLSTDIRTINRLQVAKRVRELVFEEKELLYSIVKNTNEVQCKVGALLLLDEQQEAEKYLGLMDPEEIEQFQSYPVYAFYSVT